MLLGGRAGERLEPVRVVRRALLHRPFLHRGGDGVGEDRVERRALVERLLQALEDLRREALALDGRGEDVGAEDLVAGDGEVRCAQRAPVGAPLRGGDVLRAGSGHGRQPSHGARAHAIVHVAKYPRCRRSPADAESPQFAGESTRWRIGPGDVSTGVQRPWAAGADTHPRSLTTEEVVVLRRSWLARGSLLGIVAALAVPAVASADTLDAADNGVLPDSVAINSLWVILAGCLVMFMQAGFAFLEIGFSRGKNAGTVSRRSSRTSRSPRSCTGRSASPSPSASATSSATTGFFLRDYGDPQKAFPVMGLSDATIESKWFFQFVVLRRLARHRVGHDARADQVRRLHHLRDRLRRRSSTRSPRTGCSAAAGCRPTSACRTSPARPRST